MSIPPTLLLADDSLTIQRVVSLTFADQPVRVVVAKDGQDAINRMTSDRPDLVLADTNMPCVDGYELARWVRQQPHLSAVPVLLLAGVTDPVDEQRLHDSGANGVLEKPFEPSHVISRVKELLGIKSAPPAATARLVTAPDVRPPRKAPLPKPGTGSPTERLDAAAPPPRPAELSRPMGTAETGFDEAFASEAAPASLQPSPPFRDEGFDTQAEAHDMGGARGDARDWFSGDSQAGNAGRSLADELGVSDQRFYGQGEDVPVARGLDRDFASERAAHGGAVRTPSSSSPADAFESLLAAEQGDPAARVMFQSAAPEMTSEMLDQLADRVVERLRPTALRDELQRGLGMGLREAVAHTVRESVASETRAAVAEAVQAAVNGTILGTIRGAVNEAVAAAVPAAIDQHVGPRVEHAVRSSAEQAMRAGVGPVLQERLGASLTDMVRETVGREMREAVAPLVQRTVREAVEAAVRAAVADAVAAAVPAAVLDAVRGDSGGQVREIVHDTSERLIREEIARIRERRTS